MTLNYNAIPFEMNQYQTYMNSEYYQRQHVRIIYCLFIYLFIYL